MMSTPHKSRRLIFQTFYREVAMYKYGYVKQEGVVNPTTHILFNTWRMMNVRCYDERHKAFHRYGGRKITVCPEWYWGNPEGFYNFLIDMGCRVINTTLDRIDNNRGYSKDNCKWSSKKEQQNNLGVGVKNTSGVIGVIKKGSRWTANTLLHGRYKILGNFDLKEDAEVFYNTIRDIKITAGDDKALDYLNSFKQELTGKRKYARKTSKYYGVRLHRDGVRYSAATHYTDSSGGLKQKYLGLYWEEEEAAKAVEDFVNAGRVVDD